MPYMARQGDVLIVQVDEIPAEAVRQIKGPIILAHGEATGHAHRVANRLARYFEATDGRRFLDVATPAKVLHEEHDPITLPAGKYEVIRQLEYTPEAIRTVVD